MNVSRRQFLGSTADESIMTVEVRYLGSSEEANVEVFKYLTRECRQGFAGSRIA
jgi:hypothetical protein